MSYDESDLDQDLLDNRMETAHWAGRHDPDPNDDCWVCQRNQRNQGEDK